MIPARTITTWRSTHPWTDDRQVEQDLILTRLAIEIGNHQELGHRLVWRGGTCLHKVVLPTPLRYSEDLDYVAFNVSGADFGIILSAFRDIARNVGLDVIRTNSKTSKLDVRLRFVPQVGGTANVKIEVNVVEVKPLLELEYRHMEVDTDWWIGGGDVLIFHPVEMIGTKFRALAQRSKGRDLNDLELSFRLLELNNEQLAACAAHYLHYERISAQEFKSRLFGHLNNSDFLVDISRFITEPGSTFPPQGLVKKWIHWSDVFLDKAMLDIDLFIGVSQAEQRLQDWEQRQADGLLWCPTWTKHQGNMKRCQNRFPPDGECPDHGDSVV